MTKRSQQAADYKAEAPLASGSSVVTRLRQTRADMIGTADEQHYWDCHDAAAEIERLRRIILRLADQDATLSSCDGAVTVTVDATLTTEEREAIEVAAWACGRCDGFNGDPSTPALYKGNQVEATLRKLLERLK